MDEFDDIPTDLDIVQVGDTDKETDKHHSLAYLAGREAGFSEGVEACLNALSYELTRAKVTGDDQRRIVMRVRQRALDTG